MTLGRLSLETMSKILCGNIAGSQGPLSASSAPTIGAAKDDVYGERSVSTVESQSRGASVVGYRKTGNRRRPTSRPDPKIHIFA